MTKVRFIVAALAAFFVAFLLFGWSGSSPIQAQQGQLHNCPQPGKWAISVWVGDDGVETGQSLATCGTDAIDAVYYLDPDTQDWLRYFVGYPELNTLLTLGSPQGIITHGRPTPAPTPAPQIGVGKIAFLDDQGNAWVINPDGSGKTHLTGIANIDSPWPSGGDSVPSWSPSGDKLAVRILSQPGEKHYWLVSDLAGNRLATIEESYQSSYWSPEDVSWSSNGSSLIYGLYYDGIYEYSLKTGKTRQILETNYLTYDHSPVWSPNGRKLVLAHHEWGGLFYVSVIDFDEAKVPYHGEDRYNKDFSPDLKLVVEGYSEYNQPFRFQWTPDGKNLVFSSGDKEDSEVGTIYVVEFPSGSVRKIQPANLGSEDVPENVDLSNDGQKIAFFSMGELYVVGIDESNMRKLYSSEYPSIADAGYPRWSPDDSQIAFTSFISGEGQSIRLINADGTGLQEIPGTEGAHAIAWSRAAQ